MNATKIKEVSHGNITVVLNELQGNRFNYQVLAKKATPKAKYSSYKVLFNYGYPSIEGAEKKVETYIAQLQEREERIAKEKEEIRVANSKVKASDFYEVGDIIVNSWGYEQTNVEYYQVVKMTAKTIEVHEIRAEIVEGSMMSHGMACDVMPVRDSFTDNERRRYKLRVKADGYLSSPKSFYYFYKWEGRANYCSWYG